MSTYQYQPLPRDDCVRLLYLIPGQSSDAIHIHLLSVPLHEAPAYEPLSYVWGPPSPTFVVSCGPRGETLPIRRNLLDALHHLRNTSNIRRLWIDAICINQTDDEEKSRQVRMMGLIYWHGAHVIVWLGLDDDENYSAHEVFSLIRETSDHASAQLTRYGDAHSIPEVSLSDLSDLDAARWTPLGIFFRTRTWFQRGWTIQELGLAADATFICGNAQISLELYLPFIRWITTKAQLVTDKFGFDIRSQYLATEYWLSTRTPSGIAHLSFLQVLGETRSIECSNKKDYVYAFLGHPSAFEAHPGDLTPYEEYSHNFENRKLIIEPDYSRSAEEVYTEIAKNLIIHYDDLSVLSHISHSEETLADDHPSWAPRWNLHSAYTLFGTEFIYYDAAKGSKPYYKLEGNKLHLRGAEIDTIIWQHSIWEDFSRGFYRAPGTPDDIAGIDRLQALWNTYCFRLRQLHPHLNPDRMAFLYTLTAGTIDGLPAEDTENVTQFNKNIAAYQLEKITALETIVTEQRLRDLEQNSQGGDASRFLIDVQQKSEYRILILTQHGHLGLGHYAARVGDKLWIFQGVKVPYIVRSSTEETSNIKIVCEAYVHGVMRGEAFMDFELEDVVVL